MHTKAIIILITFFSFLQACSLEDNSIINNGTNSVVASELLQASIKQVAYNQSALCGRSAAAIMQYLQEHDASVEFLTQYRFATVVFDNMWSSGFYSGSLSSLNEIREIATKENEEDLKAISLILLAHEYAALSNMFGDIPFNEALQRASQVKPKYDTQANVYIGIINMLDHAVEIIGDKSSNENLFSDDLIYQGNLQNWKKFAYGLKSRCLLNQRNQNPNANEEILALINNSFANSNEQAEFSYDSEFVNPQYRFGLERPSTLYIGDHFLDQLLSTEDPRMSIFTILKNNDWEYFIAEAFLSKWFDKTESLPLLSYTELLFMRAELSFHMGTSQAETGKLLKEAITSSMLDNNLSLVDSTLDFITTNSDLNGLSDDAVLEKIMQQTYVAYYGFNHLQTWNNYRRTGYPKITSTASNPSLINPSNIVPRRFLYPESEHQYNSANVQEAKQRQGGALLDIDMWIFN